MEEVEKLKNRIWKTWHARVKAESRLIGDANLVDVLSQLYTATLIILGIYTMLVDDKSIAFVSITISVFDMAFVFCASNMNYRNRATKMKENYISLSNLYYEIISKEDNADNFSLYSKQYNDILKESENHTFRDYVKSLLEDEAYSKMDAKNKNSSKESIKHLVTLGQKAKYYSLTVIKYSLIVFCLIFPIFLTILCFVKVHAGI